MSGLQLSASTRALLEAAKSDAPAAATRAKIWGGLATAAGLGGAAAATTSMAPSLAGGTVSASKLIAMGALLGSAVTVGVTLALLRLMSPHPAPLLPHTAAGAAGAQANALETAAPGDVARAGAGQAPALPLAVPVVAANAAPASQGASAASGGSNLHGPTGPERSQGNGEAAPGTPATSHGPADLSANMVTSGSRAGRVHVLTAPPRASVGRASAAQAVEDPLMHEAALVAEARGSLVRGDAIGALRTIRAAGSLSPRALEPEELSIESHALRALGRDVEAGEVDAALRARYPEHALSR